MQIHFKKTHHVRSCLQHLPTVPKATFQIGQRPKLSFLPQQNLASSHSACKPSSKNTQSSESAGTGNEQQMPPGIMMREHSYKSVGGAKRRSPKYLPCMFEWKTAKEGSKTRRDRGGSLSNGWPRQPKLQDWAPSRWELQMCDRYRKKTPNKKAATSASLR